MIHLKKGLKYMKAKSSLGAATEEFAKQMGRPAENRISVTFQDGTIKDAGVNGIQVSDLLYFMYGTFASLNGDYPCKENLETLEALQWAITAQDDRLKNRIMRGVEGQNNA